MSYKTRENIETNENKTKNITIHFFFLYSFTKKGIQ